MPRVPRPAFCFVFLVPAVVRTISEAQAGRWAISISSAGSSQNPDAFSSLDWIGPYE
jgi:hypothetical protein